MRNLVIERISEYLRLYPDFMTQLDISPDELENLSNVELLDLLEEIYVEFYIGNIEDEI
jgi:hypothetical protein